jgi:hypothetical protein
MQTAPAHNTATPSSSRAPEGPSTSARSMPAPAGRFVPRPPQSLGSTAPMPNHGVSNPTTASTARSGGMPTTSPMRSVPHPPTTMSAHNTYPSASASRSYSTPYFGRGTPNSVPRPTGQIAPAPRSYSAPQSRGSYSARSYGGSGYGNSGGYRGYSAPSYGRSSGGSYGGGRSYSAPSSHSSGSFGGYHGGGGSHASSGGSHGSSGGGHSSSHGGHGR